MKNIWKKIQGILKELIKRYPATILTGAFCSLFDALFIGTSMDYEVIGRINVFFVIFALWAFLGEISFNTRGKRIITYVLSVIISFFLTYLIFEATETSNAWAFKLCFSYFLIVVILIFYKLYKNSGTSLGSYLVKVFSGSLIAGIISNVLSTGLLLICLVFSFLFLGDEEIGLIWRVQVLLLGFCCFPWSIYVLTNKDEKPFDFLKVLFHYVMESLVAIAFVIIYLYMIRIFVMGEIPSNQIFRILAILFMLSLPIWIMNRHYNDKTIFTKLNNILPMAFIPFIFLEIFSLVLRLRDNGLTNMRYVGIMILIFQIVYLVLYLFKKDKLDWMFFVAIGLTIVSFLVPRYNMIALSNINQTNRILKHLDKEELTGKDKSIIASSYDYVIDNFDGKTYLDSRIGDKKNKLMAIIEEMNSYTPDDVYVIDKNNDEPIDVSGYSLLKTFNESWYYSKNNNQTIMIDDINLLDILEEYLENYQNDDYFDTHKAYVVNDKKILFNRIYLRYNATNEEYENIQLNGYILER